MFTYQTLCGILNYQMRKRKHTMQALEKLIDETKSYMIAEKDMDMANNPILQFGRVIVSVFCNRQS